MIWRIATIYSAVTVGVENTQDFSVFEALPSFDVTRMYKAHSGRHAKRLMLKNKWLAFQRTARKTVWVAYTVELIG